MVCGKIALINTLSQDKQSLVRRWNDKTLTRAEDSRSTVSNKDEPGSTVISHDKK